MKHNETIHYKKRILLLTGFYLLLSSLLSLQRTFQSNHGGGHEGSNTIPRKRASINKIFTELGETYTRRAYRMTKESFWSKKNWNSVLCFLRSKLCWI